FQAEDGIRDRNVTGVQTCALPILQGDHHRHAPGDQGRGGDQGGRGGSTGGDQTGHGREHREGEQRRDGQRAAPEGAGGAGGVRGGCGALRGALVGGGHVGAPRPRCVAKRHTVAAVCTLRDSACPASGMLTASGAERRVSASSPCASLPSSQARRGGSSAVNTSAGPRPLVAAAVIPVEARASSSCGLSAPVITGRWNRLPAAARTAFGEKGSALVRVRITRLAPAASVVRIRVPTLPGSR